MPKLICICSAARSGSTFTDMFLGGHPSVASTGELNFISKAIAINEPCSCGTGMRDCSEWAKVFDTYRIHHGFDPRHDPYRLALWDARAFNMIDTAHQTTLRVAMLQARKAWLYGRECLPMFLRQVVPPPSRLARAVDNKFQLVEAIAHSWDQTHIVDSSKNAREVVELYKRRPEQVLVVLLTRDGRGVYLSRRKAGRSRRESVDGWRNYYRKFVPLLERHIAPQSLFKLRYEDLARSPSSTGRELCRFVGIDYLPAMEDLGAVSRHMAGGNDTRYSATAGIRLDERWRTALVGDELTYFQTHAGFLNASLGYQ